MADQTWKVPLTETTIDHAEADAATRVIESRWLTMGAEIAAFEREFAAALNAKHALAVANGTVALHLAYEVAGLKTGDEFCLPALTFVATLHAGLYLGAKPILVDCASMDDLTLSVEDLERKLTPRTRLIVTLPYGGFCPDMERISAIAAKKGIPIVEDACHAPLAEVHGRMIGTFGLASTWSFYGNKNLTTGEGGMIVTNDDSVAARVRLMRSHGMTSLTWQRHQTEKAGVYNVVAPGYNYRMDEIRGAIGREQLRKLPAATQRRREAAVAIRKALAPAIELGLILPFTLYRGAPVHHLCPAILPARIDRPAFRAYLADNGIQTSIHYPDMKSFPHLADMLANQSTPIFDHLASGIVTLPMGPTLTNDQINHTGRIIVEALKKPG